MFRKYAGHLITNRPTLVSKCTSIPGLSDHDIVLTDINIIPLRQKPLKRLVYLLSLSHCILGPLWYLIVSIPDRCILTYFVYLWKKADTSGTEYDLHQFSETFTSDTPINSLWTSSKNKSLSSVSKHVTFQNDLLQVKPVMV